VYVMDLSFNPRHPWFKMPSIPGVEWALEVFAADSMYGLDPSRTQYFEGLLTSTGLQWPGAQRKFDGAVNARISLGNDGCVTWSVSATMAKPVKGIKLLLRHLPQSPAESGIWTPTTPAGQTLKPTSGKPVCLRYPFPDWQTPWACIGEGSAIAVSVRADDVRPVRLYSHLPFWSDTAVVEVVIDQLATARSADFQAPDIILQPCLGVSAIRCSLDRHLAHLESAFGLVPWKDRQDVPAWARDVDLVLTLHGQHWTGYVFNTFADMTRILKEVTQDIEGSRILAYLPGWEGRYYWQYPAYAPGADLGGESGFAQLVETAKHLGVQLMPMFGATGVNVERYPDWERAVFRSPSDRYVALVNCVDWDTDRNCEDEQIFLNPGEPIYRNYLTGQISAIVDRYGVGAAFLDTSACWFNDPRHNVYAGYRDLITELHIRHPQLLICGEGWYDALLGLMPMNQRWMDMMLSQRFDVLPMRYSRVLGHLKDGAPGAGSTGVYEGGTNTVCQPLRVRGYLPALPVVEDTFTTHRQEVRNFIRAATCDEGDEFVEGSV
jgi:hypothetical protein